MAIKFEELDNVVAPTKDAETSKPEFGIDFQSIEGDQRAPMGIVRSEEDTSSSFSVANPIRYSTPRTVRGFNDPLKQSIIGLVKGGNITRNALESIPTMGEIWNDPWRLADTFTPFVNFGLSTAEWISQKAADATTGSSEYVDDMDIELPRITKVFGDYPELDTDEGISKTKEKTEREDFVSDFYSEFKEKNKSAPYLSEILSFAPDALTVFGGAAQSIPKVAATTESILGGSRAEQEGTDVGQAKVFSFLGGLVGTKVANTFMDNLTPEMSHIIKQNSKDPQLKEDSIALLNYYKDNPNVSMQLLDEGKTGNSVVDNIVSRMQKQMGNDAYDLYMDTLGQLGKTAKQSLDEVTSEFSGKSENLYKQMTTNEGNAWDDVTNRLDISETMDTKQLSASIDKALFDAPDIVKNFAKAILKSDSNSMAIQDIGKRKDSLLKDYTIRKELVDSPADLKSLKDKLKLELKTLDAEETILKGSAAQAASNLSSVDLIELIKKINNKGLLKGGNVNTSDKAQSRALLKLKETIQSSLENMPGFDKFDNAYTKAKALSSDKFNVFGYAGGKNMGKDVFNPELGKVLDEVAPKQQEIVQDMMELNPSTFSTKLSQMEEVMPKSTIKKLKKFYVEQKLNKSLLNVSTSPKDLPTVNASKYDSAISDILDSESGRKMIKDSYENGDLMLNQLSQVRALTRKMVEMDKADYVSPSTFKAWVTQLPKTVKTIFGARISDWAYTRKMLKGYGEDIGFDFEKAFNEELIGRAGGTVVGASLAPEGEETTGAAAGVLGGKLITRGRALGRTSLGKKIIEKFSDIRRK